MRSRLVTALLIVYAAGLLLPVWFVALHRSGAYTIYLVSVPLVLVVLGAVWLWSVVPVVRAGVGRRSPPVAARRRLLVATLGLAAIGLMIGVRGRLTRGLPPGSFALPFDATAWQAPDASELVVGDDTPRQKMVGDVIERVLPGKQRHEVEALLGSSDGEYFTESGRDLLYRLGMQRDVVSLDSEWLLIWLDEAGRFERAAVWTD